MAINKAKAEAQALEIRAQAEAQASKIRLQTEFDRAEAKKKAIELEAEALAKLDENALKIRMWEAQVDMVTAMYAHQRTFVDTSQMPTMAQMLNMQAMSSMGMFGQLQG